MNSPQLLRTLNAILSNAHIRVPGENDIILKEMYCPGDIRNCYRHILLNSSAKTAYNLAKKILYQSIAPFKMKNGSYQVYPIYLNQPLIFQEPKDGRFSPVIRNFNINVVWFFTLF